MGDYRRTPCWCILDLLSDVGASMMDDKLDMGDIAFFILMAVIFIIIAIWLNDWLKPRLEARFGVIE